MTMNPHGRLKAAFRVDASLDIGTGHVMRCLTLADALAERGVACRFVCREHPGNLIELIRQRGFAVDILAVDAATVSHDDAGPAHASWLGCDWTTDASQTRTVLDGADLDWLVVDHYALDARWEKAMRPQAGSLLVIDDLADRPHDCDVLLDQGYGRNAGDYRLLVPQSCRLLVGTGYALLRPQFAERRSDSLARRRSASPRTILVSLGGVDKADFTSQVLAALHDCNLPGQAEIFVVMGPHAPWLETVRARSAGMPWKTTVMTNVEDMAGLMVQSDLAIGAAGSTSWERCALGLPTIMMIVAENQKDVGRRLADEGAAILVEAGASFSATLRDAVNSLVSDASLLGKLSERAAAVCDGKGCGRVARELIGDDGKF